MIISPGWVRQFVVVCDFKLFLYDISADRNALPSVHVSQILDMRDPQFNVSSVKELDVIHANKKDIPCIFKVCITCLLDLSNILNRYISVLSIIINLMKIVKVNKMIILRNYLVLVNSENITYV